jgi:hypothetical protein
MDNGGEFKREFKEKMKELNIGISNTIPYMPRSNSIVERSNGIIKIIFNKLKLIHADQDYRADRFESNLTLTNRNSMVSTSWILRFGVCHEKVKLLFSFDGNSANRKWR